MKRSVTYLLKNKMDDKKASDLADKLASGTWTHDYPLTFTEASELGLDVSCDMPEEIYQLMNLFPQPVRHERTVEYVDLPYRSGKTKK